MKLFTKDINQKLFAQYRIGSNLNQQNVVAKIFNPYGIGRWYLLNSDPNDPDYLWAIVQMGDVVEVGSVLRSELETIRVKPFGLPLERDLYFSDRNAMEILDGLEKGKTFAKGGETEEGVDLFEDYENIPQNVQNVLDKYSDAFEDGSYKGLSIAKKELEKIGYTFEYGLGGGAYDLRKIGEKGKNEDEYAQGGELNLGIRKIAEQEGFTPKQLGKEYELVMAQAIVESLTDANFHNEARKLISLLENKPEWENKPEYGTKEYEKWEKSGVYNSKYWDADEKTRDFAIKVSQKSGWDGYAIASAFEYLVRIDGGYHKLADKIEKAMESKEEMASGGKVGKHSINGYGTLKNGTKVYIGEGSQRYPNTDNVGVEGIYYDVKYQDGKEKLVHMDEIVFPIKGSMAKGGGIYTTDSLYYLQVIKDDKEVAREKFRAKSLKEAKEISEEEYESNYISKYGNPLNFIVSEAMEDGGKLIGNQKKLDVNKNGKLDAEDFKMLRGKMEEGGYISYANGDYENKLGNFETLDSAKKFAKANKSKYESITFEDEFGDNIVVSNEDSFKDIDWLFSNEMAMGGELSLKVGDNVELQNGMKAKVIKLKNRWVVVETNKEYGSDKLTVYKKDVIKMAMGGKVKFADKVKEVKASLLKRKKVSPKVQKDYGKTYSPKEAEQSAKRIIGAQVKKYEVKKKFKKGGKTIAQTPAPSKDRVYGSSKNKVGSASSQKSAMSIKLDEDIVKTLTNKAKEYNENHSSKVSTSTLKAVMRRGMGAYSTSHRPTISGGAPNSRQAWGFARVNKFLLKKGGTKVKKAYVQDDDLLK